MAQWYSQILIIGGGIAGCSAALRLADAGFDVVMCVTGPQMDGGNSSLAQGGIIYRPDEKDTPLLVKDVMTAGCRHNSLKAVRALSEKGPEAVRKVLIERLRVPFDLTPEGRLDFTREGGHSTNRIIHCADHTGKTIMEYMMAAVKTDPHIRVLEGRTAIDLITTHHHPQRMEYRYQLQNQCLGAYVLNEGTGEVEVFLADWTILATGGVGQVYQHTTNRPTAHGSGIAMAYRAGVKLENMEYVQFHPTALYHRNADRFLISESVRGEGARLMNKVGEYFMKRYDPRMDLAPRDIVSRANLHEMLSRGDECVYLDLSGIKQNIAERFPMIYSYCLKLGLDITHEPVPVVPVAHYFCGGILTDLNGRTTLDGLYAVGECACTGVHGANRLASTSLLEALLWGQNAGQDIARRDTKSKRLTPRLRASIPEWENPGTEHNDDPTLIALDWSIIRTTMWNYVGIIRTKKRLYRAFEDLRSLSRRLHDFYKTTQLTRPLVDLFHGCQTAYIITQAALRNPKSLGCHYRE